MSEYTETTPKIYPDDDFATQYEAWLESLEPTERQAALEQLAFEREQERQSLARFNGTMMLLVRECTHKKCSTRCQDATYAGAFAV